MSIDGARGPAARRHDAMVAAREAQYRRTRGAEADFWGAVAARFRADPRRPLDPFLDRLASYLRPEDVLVDVGGGAGRNSLPMALRCREVINVEPSAGMVAEFEACAREAGIANARCVQRGWLEAEGVEGDLLLAAHVTYFVPEIAPFVEKLDRSARRRVVIAVLTPPPPNQLAPFFELVYGEEQAPAPGPDELLAVLREMGIEPEVVDIGPAAARRPLAQTREEAVNNELAQGWLAQRDAARAKSLFEEHFDELFVETPEGFARRTAVGARELIFTWETGAGARGPDGRT